MTGVTRTGDTPAADGQAPLLDCRDLVVTFPSKRGREPFTAVDHASLAVGSGEVVGLVGESGSGKSTIARAVVGLQPLDSGAISFTGEDLAGRRTLAQRSGMQMVFQDPYGSLDPRMSIRGTLSEMVPDTPRFAAKRWTTLPRAARLGGAALRHPRLPARRNVGRPAATRCHRPSLVGRTTPARRRRGGCGTRRVGAGRDRQPAGRPSPRRWPVDPLHLARPVHRAHALRPGRRHPPGEDRRGAALRRPLRQPAARLHQGTARRHPEAAPAPRSCVSPGGCLGSAGRSPVTPGAERLARRPNGG